MPNKVMIEDAVDVEKNLVVARAFEPLSKAVVKQIADARYHQDQGGRYRCR